MPISDRLQDSIIKAESILLEILTVNTTVAATHKVVEVTGWQNADAINALSSYLVALRASVLDQAGRICSELIGNNPDDATALLRSVDEIVVQPEHSGETSADWKGKWRNPWIAEGLWHCCLWVAMKKAEFHTQGTIIALDFPHISPKDHGLDVTALYVKENGTLGMSFVETKAYRDNPNGAISDAVTMLKAIEAGEHDTRLRQMVTSFRAVIEEPYKQQLSSSLWKNERTLIPNPHYEAKGASVQWSRSRRASFLNLIAPVIIMPHCVNGYDAFFDKVAHNMHRKAREVVRSV